MPRRVQEDESGQCTVPGSGAMEIKTDQRNEEDK